MTFDFVDRFRTVIGGYRYRGALSPINGFYLGADAADAKVVIAPPKTVAAIGQPQIPWDYVARKSAQLFNTTITLNYPVSLAQDNAGNLYLLDLMRQSIVSLSTPTSNFKVALSKSSKSNNKKLILNGNTICP